LLVEDDEGTESDDNEESESEDEGEDEDEYGDKCKYCGDCARSVYSVKTVNRTKEADKSSVVLFLHIQKVGGTTLWKLLATMLPPCKCPLVIQEPLSCLIVLTYF